MFVIWQHYRVFLEAISTFSFRFSFSTSLRLTANIFTTCNETQLHNTFNLLHVFISTKFYTLPIHLKPHSSSQTKLSYDKTEIEFQCISIRNNRPHLRTYSTAMRPIKRTDRGSSLNVKKRVKYLGQRSISSNCSDTQTHAHSGPIALPGPRRWSVKIVATRLSAMIFWLRLLLYKSVHYDWSNTQFLFVTSLKQLFPAETAWDR